MFKQKLSKLFMCKEDREAILIFDQGITLSEYYDIGQMIQDEALKQMNKLNDKKKESNEEAKKVVEVKE